MKTLPHLKQFTYATIIVAFPFIFSASKESKAPELEQVTERRISVPLASPKETLKIIRVTVDSLKNSNTSSFAQVN
jgi:hypothetical protein